MSVVYDRSQFSSACDNITTGPYSNIVGSVGGYIYKNAAGQTFKDHIKGCLEVNAGAHYYVQSPYDCYASASARIDLSKASIDPKDRNGYISLSMVMAGQKAGQCDIGLGYLDGKWQPVKWCRDIRVTGSVAGLPETSSSGLWTPLANQNAVVDITITISSTSTTETFTGVFKIGNDEIAHVTYSGDRGDFFAYHWSQNKPLVRFVRFMSLVPQDPSEDDKDFSTMEGEIENLKINGSNWNADRIEYAWSVQGANIESLKISNLATSSIAQNADYIKINHRYQLT